MAGSQMTLASSEEVVQGDSLACMNGLPSEAPPAVSTTNVMSAYSCRDIGDSGLIQGGKSLLQMHAVAFNE